MTNVNVANNYTRHVRDMFVSIGADTGFAINVNSINDTTWDINSITSRIHVTRISCNFPVFDGLFYFSNNVCIEMLSKPEPDVLKQMLKTYKNSRWVDFKDVHKP